MSIPSSGAGATLQWSGPKRGPRLGLRVEAGAKVVDAAAAVKNHQSRHLRGQFRFACLGEEPLRLGGERGKHIGYERTISMPWIHCLGF